jgi:hypothetical protein
MNVEVVEDARENIFGGMLPRWHRKELLNKQSLSVSSYGTFGSKPKSPNVC